MFRLHRHHLLLSTSVIALAVLVPAGTASAGDGSATSGPAGSCQPLLPFRPGDFHDPTRIDSRYLPMVPGTQSVYEGQTSEGSHAVVFTVTDLVKIVDGVTTRVVLDVDQEDGAVDEAELAFFAQDDDGNVWNLGEYPEEFENDEFAGAPDVWIGGLRGARPGVHMPARREAAEGVQYLQGRAPAIEFLDCATIADDDGRLTVPAGHFTDVLTIHETSPLESTTAIQTKEHAPHVGIIRIGAINDPEDETLVLTRYVHLSAGERDRLNGRAMALDAHGHSDSISPLYRSTPRVHVG
jgi:hypothetical protein